MPQPALLVDDLVIRYPGRAAAAVDHATWAANPGEVTALLGPNGAGKTSTIECCVGLRGHSEGQITALGRSGAALGTADHRAQVGVMLQDGGLPTGAKPVAVLRHFAKLYAQPANVDELVERLGIAAFARTGVRRLSGGQKQRLALAAALIGRPRLLFLDEPTAGLDTESRVEVRQIIAEQCAEGTAVVLTTHDLDEAARVSARVVVMNAGRVVANATPSELTANLPRALVVRLPRGAEPSGLMVALPSLRPVSAGIYRVAGAEVGPRQAAIAAQWCDDNGYRTAELELSPPSLEDVVRELTR